MLNKCRVLLLAGVLLASSFITTDVYASPPEAPVITISAYRYADDIYIEVATSCFVTAEFTPASPAQNTTNDQINPTSRQNYWPGYVRYE
jgi:hypothetical protein